MGVFLAFLSEVAVVVLGALKTIVASFVTMMDSVLTKLGEALINHLKHQLASV